ncbi:hypothetical protein [Oryzibacter oryziterrae]|uniref:hypothetical protein n=1 Tax=Oryzibacter oryziterrae TaxID=2766474 RepID=UPI001F382B28|nr:hypothetical protein [Oryzibacter oryziterrae]
MRIGVFLSFTIVAAFLATPTSAAGKTAKFVGALQFTTVNANCTDGPASGSIFPSRFKPFKANVTSGSSLSILDNYDAKAYRLDNKLFGSSYVRVGYGDTVYVTTPASDAPVYLKITKSVPAMSTLTSTTPTVYLEGTIKNPSGQIGQEACEASFTASFVQKH